MKTCGAGVHRNIEIAKLRRKHCKFTSLHCVHTVAWNGYHFHVSEQSHLDCISTALVDSNDDDDSVLFIGKLMWLRLLYEGIAGCCLACSNLLNSHLLDRVVDGVVHSIRCCYLLRSTISQRIRCRVPHNWGTCVRSCSRLSCDLWYTCGDVMDDRDKVLYNCTTAQQSQLHEQCVASVITWFQDVSHSILTPVASSRPLAECFSGEHCIVSLLLLPTVRLYRLHTFGTIRPECDLHAITEKKQTVNYGALWHNKLYMFSSKHCSSR